MQCVVRAESKETSVASECEVQPIPQAGVGRAFTETTEIIFIVTRLKDVIHFVILNWLTQFRFPLNRHDSLHFNNQVNIILNSREASMTKAKNLGQNGCFNNFAPPFPTMSNHFHPLASRFHSAVIFRHDAAQELSLRLR